LVERAQRGDKRAFGMLVEKYQRKLGRLLSRLIRDQAEVEDVVQESFIKAYRALPNFRGESAFYTWLYRIGVNVCLNRVSVNAPKVEAIEVLDRVTGPGEPADQTLIRQETARRVRHAIARLPPKQRATLILRTYQELPHEEIAGILGSSVGAVKANFFHALANLKKLLIEQ